MSTIDTISSIHSTIYFQFNFILINQTKELALNWSVLEPQTFMYSGKLDFITAVVPTFHFLYTVRFLERIFLSLSYDMIEHIAYGFAIFN